MISGLISLTSKWRSGILFTILRAFRYNKLRGLTSYTAVRLVGLPLMDWLGLEWCVCGFGELERKTIWPLRMNTFSPLSRRLLSSSLSLRSSSSWFFVMSGVRKTLRLLISLWFLSLKEFCSKNLFRSLFEHSIIIILGRSSDWVPTRLIFLIPAFKSVSFAPSFVLNRLITGERSVEEESTSGKFLWHKFKRRFPFLFPGVNRQGLVHS